MAFNIRVADYNSNLIKSCSIVESGLLLEDRLIERSINEFLRMTACKKSLSRKGASILQ